MLVVFYYATLLPKMGTGPMWQSLTQPMSDSCADKWWANMVYLNNIPNKYFLVIQGAPEIKQNCNYNQIQSVLQASGLDSAI